eukprot:11271628-Alexandrium_andersonii.AAC.1
MHEPRQGSARNLVSVFPQAALLLSSLPHPLFLFVQLAAQGHGFGERDIAHTAACRPEVTPRCFGQKPQGARDP